MYQLYKLEKNMVLVKLNSSFLVSIKKLWASVKKTNENKEVLNAYMISILRS